MSAELPPSPVDLAREADFQLGGLAVRPSRRELVAGAERSLIEPRVMQVLVALTRSRGEVVSRDALIASCWGGRIVGDDAINACVAKVRRAGEASGAYAIETIPRVGYRLTAAGGAKNTGGVASPGDVLLAVLPFENLSGDPELGYFSDGVSEEILNALAQRTDLKVIGRSSSFQFRGADKAIPNVARQLNVTHVLDGAVRRSGERTRISAQLIDCATQATVWSDRIERELADIFALQDQVTVAVTQAMRCALAPAVRSGAVDPVAYDLYLRGNAPPSELSEGYATQIGQLEEAVERAPGFADAWGCLGYLRASRAYFGTAAEAAVLRQAAREAASRALELDPRCGLAAAAMARAIPSFDAVAEHAAWLDRAMQWAPNDAIAIRLYARLLSSVGRGREALVVIRRAQRLHPLDMHIRAILGRTLAETGALDEATAVLGAVRDRWGEFQLLPLWMGVALAMKGDITAARAVLAGSDLGPYAQGLAAFIDIFGDPTSAAGRRADAALRAQFERSGRISLDVLSSAVERGDIDAALDIALRGELGPAPDQRSQTGGSGSNLAILFTLPLPRLRRDVRFVRLCARLGLVVYWLATDTWPDCVEEVAPYYDFKAECRRVAEGAPASG